MRALSRRLTLVFLCAGLPGCVGGPRPDLTRGLVGHWKFDGDVSDLCLDFTVTEETFGENKARIFGVF